MKPKPAGCKNCQFKFKGIGFCPPEAEGQPKIAVLLEAPKERDVRSQKPLMDFFGHFFDEQILEPLGLSRDDLLIDHLIRCRPPGDKWPTGKAREAAELGCRTWDQPLKDFGATVAIPCYSIHAMRMVPTTIRLIQSVFQRALDQIDKGERPLVLAGVRPSRIWLPELPQSQEWKKGKSFLGTWQGSFHKIETS